MVDYCIIPYEALGSFTDFNVTLEKGLFNRSNILGYIDPETSPSDHSLLTWNFLMDAHVRDSKKVNEDHKVRVSFTKVDRNIPFDFLQTRQEEINHFIT